MHLNKNSFCIDSECEITELWLEPIDLSAIADIFATMKHCQSLHPDSVDDDEGRGNQISQLRPKSF